MKYKKITMNNSDKIPEFNGKFIQLLDPKVFNRWIETVGPGLIYSPFRALVDHCGNEDKTLQRYLDVIDDICNGKRTIQLVDVETTKAIMVRGKYMGDLIIFPNEGEFVQMNIPNGFYLTDIHGIKLFSSDGGNRDGDMISYLGANICTDIKDLSDLYAAVNDVDEAFDDFEELSHYMDNKLFMQPYSPVYRHVHLMTPNPDSESEPVVDPSCLYERDADFFYGPHLIYLNDAVSYGVFYYPDDMAFEGVELRVAVWTSEPEAIMAVIKITIENPGTFREKIYANIDKVTFVDMVVLSGDGDDDDDFGFIDDEEDDEYDFITDFEFDF